MSWSGPVARHALQPRAFAGQNLSDILQHPRLVERVVRHLCAVTLHCSRSDDDLEVGERICWTGAKMLIYLRMVNGKDASFIQARVAGSGPGKRGFHPLLGNDGCQRFLR